MPASDRRAPTGRASSPGSDDHVRRPGRRCRPSPPPVRWDQRTGLGPEGPITRSTGGPPGLTSTDGFHGTGVGATGHAAIGTSPACPHWSARASKRLPVALSMMYQLPVRWPPHSDVGPAITVVVAGHGNITGVAPVLAAADAGRAVDDVPPVLAGPERDRPRSARPSTPGPEPPGNRTPTAHDHPRVGRSPPRPGTTRSRRPLPSSTCPAAPAVVNRSRLHPPTAAAGGCRRPHPARRPRQASSLPTGSTVSTNARAAWPRS